VETFDKLTRIGVEWLKDVIMRDLNKMTSIKAQLNENGTIEVLDTMYKDRFTIAVVDGFVTKN
jgi:hypothetical protein